MWDMHVAYAQMAWSETECIAVERTLVNQTLVIPELLARWSISQFILRTQIQKERLPYPWVSFKIRFDVLVQMKLVFYQMKYKRNLEIIC